MPSDTFLGRGAQQLPRKRSARVCRSREDGYVVVERSHPDGSFDYSTFHYTRLGARVAAWCYVRSGRLMGMIA